MFCAGLTGGIGSGKSTLASMLVQHGAALIDADEISRQSTAAGGAAIAPIEAIFGSTVLTPSGALDRVAMRALMLTDRQAKACLEQIIHPIVAVQIDEQRRHHDMANIKLCVIDIPLLTEGATGWRPRLDAVWLVDCSEDTQRQRVARRSNWPASQIDAVIAAQSNRHARRKIADLVIINEDADLQQLARQVKQVVRQFGL